jgi:hypothetical protein
MDMGSASSTGSVNSALSRVLDSDGFADKMTLEDREEREEEEDMNAVSAPPPGMCIECEDQPQEVLCEACGDVFCEVCFSALHRRGKRRQHVAKKLTDAGKTSSSSTSQAPQKKARLTHDTNEEKEEDIDADDEGRAVSPTPAPVSVEAMGEWFLERSKYIPVRLNLKERKLLRLLEAALQVSEYTDKVDIISFKGKAKRVYEQLQDICAILSGLVVANDYKAGQQLIKDHNFKDNEDFFQTIFEVGRRYKIMNPEKMRSTYGKLVYLLQDSVNPEIQELLQFSCSKSIKTVFTVLTEHGAVALLKDPHIMTATKEISADGKSRGQIRYEIKEKERAVKYLSERYATGGLTQESIETLLYSIGDNNSYLTFNRDPVDKMIVLLKQYFSPTNIEEGYSLAISYGQKGARLTHNHERQYYYALQSLTLWREIANDMFKLWYLSEEDLLSTVSPYRLRDTGQGLNRVQQAPQVRRAMHSLLYHCQEKIGHWVGSSVIHLGDHNVPNALMFIDKYTQVSRILNPIVICIQQIEELVKDDGLKRYIEHTFGGVEKLRKDILRDFFMHAFDGSGADNFFDAGSCIDGRLTSAWNWCSKIEKKSYYPIFLLTGFIGFDGDFQK